MDFFYNPDNDAAWAGVTEADWDAACRLDTAGLLEIPIGGEPDLAGLAAREATIVAEEEAWKASRRLPTMDQIREWERAYLAR